MKLVVSILCFLASIGGLWAQFPPTDEMAVYTEPALNLPDYDTNKPFFGTIQEPTFGTAWGSFLTRIVGTQGTQIPNLPAGTNFGCVRKHKYHRIQPWSWAGKYLWLVNATTNGQDLFMDGFTYQPLAGVTNPPGESCRWLSSINTSHSETEQTMLCMSQSDTHLVWFNPFTNTTAKDWTLPATPSVVGLGNGEGNADGSNRFLFLHGTSLPIKGYMVDMWAAPGNPAAFWPTTTLTQPSGGGAIDACSVTPSGLYVVCRWSGNKSIQVYDVNDIAKTVTVHAYTSTAQSVIACNTVDYANGVPFKLAHPDVGSNVFDPGGEYVFGRIEKSTGDCQSYGGSYATLQGTTTIGRLIGVRLYDGGLSNLLSYQNSSGVQVADIQSTSARDGMASGYVYVGFRRQSGDVGLRFYDEVAAVKMRGPTSTGIAVRRLAHQHSTFLTGDGCPVSGYACSSSGVCFDREPHPVPSRDGRRVLFVSDWTLNGNGLGDGGPMAFVVSEYPGGY